MSTPVYDDVSASLLLLAANVLGAPVGETQPILARQLVAAVCALSGGTTTVRVANGSSFDIPQYDEIDFTYVNGGVADDDNIATQVFKKDGATVVGGTLTYSYQGATNNIVSIVQS